MAHFAKVENGIVTQVIVAEQDVIDSGMFGTGWVQTSYNTHGGWHPNGRPLRKNYAGIGYIYDISRDAFIPPKPSPAAVLNEDTCLWTIDASLSLSDETVDTNQAETITIIEIDSVVGGNGADSMIGGNGADSMIGGNGADSITGGLDLGNGVV